MNSNTESKRWSATAPRRAFAGILAAGLALAVLGASAGFPWEGPAAAGATHQRPNFVIVQTDDQNHGQDLRVMQKTRRLLRDRGLRFKRYYATNPLCCPSRASLLTGRYSHNHGVLTNSQPAGGHDAFDPSSTLAVWLQDAGYRTGLVGKYLNGYGRDDDPEAVPPGWDQWRALWSGSAYRMYRFTINFNGRLHRYPRRERFYQTDVLSRQAERFLIGSANDSQPFFLALNPVAPHLELPRQDNFFLRPAPRHRDRFRKRKLPKPPSYNEANVSDKPPWIQARPRLTREDKAGLTKRHRNRLRALLAVDDAVGRLVKVLRETGQLSNTYILFLSDNGILKGEHRIRMGKGLPYEENVRMPLLIRGPGVARGERTGALAANIDIAPTVAGLAGVAPGSAVDGRSLAQTFTGANASFGRGALLLESYHGSGERRYRGIRTRRYVLTLWNGSGGHGELYDMEADPYQLRNRYGDPDMATRQAALERRLAQLEDCAGASCRAADADIGNVDGTGG